MIRSAFPALCFLLSSSFALHAAGTTGAATLTQPTHSRATGLGEAFSSLDSDAAVYLYNPAGPATLSGRQSYLNYQKGGDENLISLLYAHPTRQAAWLGALTYFNAGAVDLVTTSGEEHSLTAQEDWILALGCSRKISRWGLFFGVNGKAYFSAIAESVNTWTPAADLGLLWRTPVHGLNAGLSVRNLGKAVKYLSDEDPLPTAFRGGLSYKSKFGPQDLLFAADYQYARYEKGSFFLFGAEYLIQEAIALRLGYRLESEKSDLLDQQLSTGLGFQWKKRYSLDYSFRSADRLDNSHQFTLGAKF